jgi:hypothetical protein
MQCIRQPPAIKPFSTEQHGVLSLGLLKLSMFCSRGSSGPRRRAVTMMPVSTPKVLVRPVGQRQYEWVDLWESYVSGLAAKFCRFVWMNWLGQQQHIRSMVMLYALACAVVTAQLSWQHEHAVQQYA